MMFSKAAGSHAVLCYAFSCTNISLAHQRNFQVKRLPLSSQRNTAFLTTSHGPSKMKLIHTAAILAATASAFPAVFPHPRPLTDHHPQGLQEVQAPNATNGSIVVSEKIENHINIAQLLGAEILSRASSRSGRISSGR